MPRMSGADMVRAIRAESAFDGMPIILMSAAAALGEGVPSDGFFEMPFPLDTLIATVARLLSLARVQVNAPGGTGAQPAERVPSLRRRGRVSVHL